MALRTSVLIAALVAGAILVGHAEAQARPRPNIVFTCFVRNCVGCSARNPYVCASCGTGYALTGGFGCNSCAPGYEQNLDERTFVCSKCPPGFTSPGGTGEASQCTEIPSASRGRRLFQEEDDLWSWA